MSISRTFPAKHPRAGEKTYFEGKIRYGIGIDSCVVAVPYSKIHTIRANYMFWKKRIDEVNAGKAVLVLFEWNGKPYGKGTIQRELFRFDKDSGIGVQKLEWISSETAVVNPSNNCMFPAIAPFETLVNTPELANNDGLSERDFRDWFKDYDLSEPLAIVHFTKFRY